MKKHILYLFFGCILTIKVYSQITFEKIYFANQIGFPTAAYEDSNSYILSAVVNNYTPILIKTNLYGDTIWTKIIQCGGCDMAKTNIGDFVILGGTSNLNTKSDIHLCKINGSGNVLWTDSIIKQNYDNGYRIKQTYDNGYIVVGESNSLPGIYVPYPYNAYIVKTNSLGDSTWTRNFGRNNFNDYAYDVIETSDSNYVVVGCSEDCGVNNCQVYLIKLKPDGDTLWTKNFGNTLYEYGYCIQETLDKNYIISGRKGTANTYSDVYLIKTDTNGNVLWDKTYNIDLYSRGDRIIVLNNGYLIAGITSGNMGLRTALLIRINDLGDTLWTKTIKSNNPITELRSINKCSDNGFIITGYTPDWKLIFMKTDSLGCIKPNIISITGEHNVSLNDTITFQNNSIRGRGYNWFSYSGNIASAPGLDYIKIYWNQTGTDTLYSVSYNDCGSDTLSYIINIDSCVAPKISSINGDFNPSFGNVREYYISKIEGKTPVNYYWNSNIGTIISGQGTDSISVGWYNEGFGSLVVTATNICGIDTSSVNMSIFIGSIRKTIDVNNLNVSVFPVPTNSILYLNFPIDFPSYEVEVFDIYGKQKFNYSMIPGLNEINISDQPNGVYFLKIVVKNKIIIKKIILSK